MAQTQRANIDNFGGGCNSEKQNHEINTNESPADARNIRIYGNSKAPRPGYTTFTTSLGSQEARGIFGWERESSTNDRLITVYNQNCYLTDVDNETRGNAITTTTTADTKTNFTQYKDWAFLFNGTDEIGRLSQQNVVFNGVFAGGEESGTLNGNWTYTTGVYDVTFSNGDERAVTLTNGATTATWTGALSAAATATATTIVYDEPATKPDSISSGSDFTPKFGTIFLNSMIVGGVPTATNSFFLSKPALTSAPEDIYDFSGAIKGGNADEVLMQSRGTAAVEMSGFAVLFTVNSASIITGFKDLGSSIVPDVQPIKGADGCCNERCAVVVGNDVYYLTPKKEIRTVRKGFDESLSALTDPVSRKIDPTLSSGIDDSFATDAYGYYDRKNKLLKFHVRKVGSSFPDLVIVGHLEELDENGNPKFTFDDGKGFVDGEFFNNRSFTLSTAIGQLFEDEVGLADYNDVRIPVTWCSKNFNGEAPTLRKRYRNLNVYGFISTTTSVEAVVYVDDIEAARVTIDSNDVLTNQANLGGVATQGAGEFAVGDDEVVGEAQNLFELVKRIPFRKTGRKIKVCFESDQINTNYLISAANYDAIALGKQNVPIAEKL
jgi:hypothetical protein